MTKKNTTPTKTYTLEMEMYEGEWWAKFSFNAQDEADARSKAQKWGRYHGMSNNEVRVREANENEAANWLHNEYIN